MLKSIFIKNFCSQVYPRKGVNTSYLVYPKIFQIKNRILEKPDYSKIENHVPQYIKTKKEISPYKVKENQGPLKDIINFKLQSGNEILYNLDNMQYFTRLEKLNAFFILNLRLMLPENEEVRDKGFNHPNYIKLENEIVRMINNLNLKHTTELIITFDKIDCNKIEIWKKLQNNVLRNLHQIKDENFVQYLCWFNKPIENNDITTESEETSLSLEFEDKITYRGNSEFFHRLITILPMKVDKITAYDVVRSLEVIYEQKINANKCVTYFIYPRFEKTAGVVKFSTYIRMLRILAKIGYNSDVIFWKDYILPAMHNFDFDEEDIAVFKDCIYNIKINCPGIELSKYFVIIDKIVSSLAELREEQAKERVQRKLEGKYEKRIQIHKIRIEKDLSLSKVATGRKSKINDDTLRFINRAITEKKGESKAAFLREVNEKYAAYKETKEAERVKEEEDRLKKKEMEKQKSVKKKKSYSSEVQSKEGSNDSAEDSKEKEASKMKKEKAIKIKKQIKEKSINLD